MTIMLLLSLGIIAFEVFYYFSKKKARATKSEWYPNVEGDKIKYIDIGDLTLPQAQVFLEDVRAELKKNRK